MAIKIYESQIRPTDKTAGAYSTAGVSIDPSIAAAPYAALKGTLRAGEDLYIGIEKQKSENELIKIQEKMNNGDDTFEGLTETKRKASLMTDPKAAQEYFNSAFEKAKSMSTLNGFTGNFTKKYFDNYSVKAHSLGSTEILKNSNDQLYLESKNLSTVKTNRFILDKNSGATPEIRQDAAVGMETYLNSKEFQELHGGDTIKEAYKVRGDDELTQAKNQILINAFTDPDKLISKFRNLTPAQADKIKAFSKSQIGTMQAANGQNIDNANKQADKFQPVNEKEINTMAAIANAGKNSKHQENINELNIKNEINKIVTGKTDGLSEFLDSQISEKKSLLSSEATSVSQKKILQTQLTQYELIQKAYKDNPLEAAKSFKVFASPIADDSNNGIKKLNLGNFLQNPYQDLSSLEQAGKERAAQSTHVEKDIPGAKSTVFLNSEVDEVVSALTNAKNDRQLMGTFKVIAKASGGKGLDAFKQIMAKDKDLVGHAYIGGLTNELPEQEGNRLLALYTKGYFLSKNKTVGVELGNDTNRPKIEAVNKYLNNIFNQDPITAKGVKDAAVNIWLGKKVSEGKSTTTIDGDFDKIVSNLLGGTDSHGGIDTSLNQKNIAVAPMWLPKNKLSDVLEMFKNKPELFYKATGGASGLGTATNETFNPFDVKYPETTGDYGETIIEDKNVRYPALVNVGNGVYKLAYGDATQPDQEDWIISDSGNSNNKELTVNLNLIKDEVLQIIKDNEITFAKTVRGVGSYIGSGIEAMATIDKTPSQLNATISNTSKKDLPTIKVENKKQEMGITGDLVDKAGQNIAYQASEFFFGDPAAFETLGIKFDKLSPDKQEYIKAFLENAKDWLYKKPGKISFPTNEKMRQHNKNK